MGDHKNWPKSDYWKVFKIIFTILHLLVDVVVVVVVVVVLLQFQLTYIKNRTEFRDETL